MGQQNNYTDAERVTVRVMRHLHAQEAEKSGDLSLAARHIAMAYQLFTAANTHAEEANEIMSRYGLTIGKMKTVQNNLMQSFDAYDKAFMKRFHIDAAGKAQMCGDADVLRDMLTAFAQYDIEVERGPYYQAKLFLPRKG